MYNTSFWVHVVTGYILIAFILIPILIPMAKTNRGVASTIVGMNRIVQYLLVIAFLSGGYMVSKVDFGILWLVAVIILLLIMFAMSGMVTKPLKNLANGQTGDAKKAVIFSLVFLVAYIMMMAIMSSPQLLM